MREIEKENPPLLNLHPYPIHALPPPLKLPFCPPPKEHPLCSSDHPQAFNPEVESFIPLPISTLSSLISPWSSSVIKPVGKSFATDFLIQRLVVLWNLPTPVSLSAIGRGFFVVKPPPALLPKILEGGPWFINSTFLDVQPWMPGFKPSEASISLYPDWDEIFSSSFAAAMYLKSIQFPPNKKVYVIGGEGIVEELHLAGFTSLGGPEDANKKIELKQNLFFHHDKTVGAVVVGLDQYINFYKLQYATLCIRENPGCLFIATNRDAVGHMTDLQEWPGAGCMVAAVCGTTQKEPVVVGKPSTFMMDFLLKKFNVDTSRMCMVGDRLDTDILFGQSAGCKTLLVLSGVTTLPALQDSANNIVPDYYTDKVSDLLQLLGP
ncbi:phosphoglycolate phosphatase 2-like [Chenopodium quinoa]|nr:phosphoglycolate phosphatase 2-like [Chenopodium quinoa]